MATVQLCYTYCMNYDMKRHTSMFWIEFKNHHPGSELINMCSHAYEIDKTALDRRITRSISHILKGNPVRMWIFYLLILNDSTATLLYIYIVHELGYGIFCHRIGCSRMGIVCYCTLFLLPW